MLCYKTKQRLRRVAAISHWGSGMADHSTGEHETAMDYAQHQATYNGFITATKYVSGAIIILLLLMATFLVH